MAGVTRTHRPVIDRELCQQCSVCLRACPAELLAEMRQEQDTVRGHVYRNTDLLQTEVVPPCTGACPLGQTARDYIDLLAAGRVREALLTIRQDNPLPGVCGYVCHHPCERACLRGSWDDPVTIRELKRYASHYEMDHREEIVGALMDQKQPSKGRKVVIVGAGPAGLACASEIVMQGYEVNLVDALPQPGGMLRVGVPPFRLPRNVLDHDVSVVQSLGVNFVNGISLDNEQTLHSWIRKGTEAVVLTLGTHQGLPLDIPGEGADGYVSCLHFLRSVNTGDRVQLSGNVWVIGGGYAAIDAARTALRVGSEKVTIAYRRSQAEMPAGPEEVQAALQEGVQIQYLLAPKSIVVRRGKIEALELLKMELGAVDATGRKRPIPVEGSESVEAADWVIAAIGQRPALPFLTRKSISPQGTIDLDDTGQIRGYEGVFAGGDVVTGPSTVVEAMASGKAAAWRVISYLEQQG